MSARGPNPNAPRAMFAGDAERDLQRLRDEGDPRVQTAPQQRFTVPLRRDPSTPATPATPSTPAPVEALRARIADIEGRDRAQQQQQGADPGHIVADVPRGDGSVVRVAVKRYQPEGPQQQRAPQRGDGGAMFVDLRVWSGAWPVKGKGVALRPRELARIAAALLDAADMIARERGSR